jgi:hypothetical protein
MPNASAIRDNRQKRGSAADFLREAITGESLLSFVSAYFTVHAFDALRPELEKAKNLRFLFGEPSFVALVDADKAESKHYSLKETGLGLENALPQRRLARECAEWIRSKVEIRSVVRSGFLHGKMYHNLLEPQQLDDLISQDLRFRNLQLKRLKDEVLDLEDFDESPSLTDFSLDEFRMDLLQFLESRRQELEEAPLGLYAVVPPKPAELPAARPGTLFCLRRTSASVDKPGSRENLNPLAPHFLIYVLDDGTVRFSFAQPKETLMLLRGLASGHPNAFEKLCDLFDQRTQDGSDMMHYEKLARSALRSIEKTFQRRAASALLSRRDALLPTESDTPVADSNDWELVTWLVVLDPAA